MATPSCALFVLSIATVFQTFGLRNYVTSTPNVAVNVLKRFFNDSFAEHYGRFLSGSELQLLWGLFLADCSLGSIVGCVLVSLTHQNWSRKKVLFLYCNLAVALSCIAIAVSKHIGFEILIAARFLLGVATGISTALTSVYLVEMSPCRFRGFTIALHNVAIKSGLLLSGLLGFPQLLGTDERWPILLSLPGLMALIAMAFYPFYPESPQFVFIHQKSESNATKIIEKYSGNTESVRETLERFSKEDQALKSGQSSSESIRDPSVRKSITITCVASLAIAVSGIASLDVYSTSVLESLGFESTTAQSFTLVLVSVELLISFSNPWAIEFLGRRTMLVHGLLLQTVFMSLVCVCKLIAMYWKAWKALQWIVFGALICNVLISAAAVTVAPCFIGGEMIPETLRVRAVGLGNAVMYLAATISTSLFPVVLYRIEGWAFLVLFIVPSLAVWAYLHKELPETKQRHIEDIFRELSNRCKQSTESQISYRSLNEA